MCEQEGLTNAAVFSRGQSFHGTVLHGAGTFPEEILSDVEVEVSGGFHFLQRLYELKVDELRGGFLGSGL